MIAVVKADAYGHGALPVTRALLEAGCRRVAVSALEEALELRGGGLEVPILVLGGVRDAEEARVVAERGLTPTVHGERDLELCAAAASRAGVRLPVHVEVDTGMRRMGVPAAEAASLIEASARQPALLLEGVFTHFARADETDLEPSLAQIAVFRRVLEAVRRRGIRAPLVHAANSAALLAGKALAEALPEANAVRPGLMLYGVSPAPHLEVDLRPAMRLSARVVSVRRLRPGDGVGYGARFRAQRATRLATLPVGYADGVPLAASNRGAALIRGRRMPFAGRVSMDYVCVDCGDETVAPGDEAVLFGEPGLGVDAAARAADTMAYELLVRVGARVGREWVE